MSAFMVNKAHIDALLTAGLSWNHPDKLGWYDAPMPTENYEPGQPWGPDYHAWAKQHRQVLTDHTADRVGTMLRAENHRSVSHRYDQDEPEELEPYTFIRLPGDPDPVKVLRALACYEYQSCEHPGWRTSEARAFCEALQGLAIYRLTRHDPTWEITDPHVFVTRG